MSTTSIIIDLPSTAVATPPLPLCVDLDGTLLKTDLLLESLVQLLRHRPLDALRLPLWLARGRATLKRELAARVSIDPQLLPYRDELVDWLRAERAAGRRIVLVTASDRSLAEPVAETLGVFAEVMASDGELNLKGSAKAEVLVRRFGSGGYVYAGDAAADVPVWQRAGGAVVVSASQSLLRAAQQAAPVLRVFRPEGSGLRALVRALRCYQWVKNVLVLVPLLAAGRLLDTSAALPALAMLAAFSMAASGVYVLNDLMDLDADRQHARKRQRPFASGALPLWLGGLGPLLLLVGLGAAAAISPAAAAVLLGYVLLSSAYSAALKRQPLVDIFTLSALYSLRIFAGGIAASVAVSVWLLTFSSFFFLALAFMKRCAELHTLAAVRAQRSARRGYDATDLQALLLMGVASSFVSSLVLALYVDSSTARATYAEPVALWGIVPLFLLWQCRVWLSTTRGYMHDDPIVYAARDWVSWLVAAFTGLTVVVAGHGVPW